MNCAKFQMNKYLEVFYRDENGDNNTGHWSKLPGHKYNKAMMAVKVMQSTASPEENFVDDFFWGKGKMSLLYVQS